MCGVSIQVSKQQNHKAFCQGKQCLRCRKRLVDNKNVHDCVEHLSTLLNDTINKQTFYQQVTYLKESKVETVIFTRSIKLLESELHSLKV